MKKPNLLTLLLPWIVLWGAAGAFAVTLYRDGRAFPAEMVGPARMRDAWLAIGAIAAVTLLFSIIWLVVWRSFVAAQKHFLSAQTAAEKAAPLMLRGNRLLILRGFWVQEIALDQIRRIHCRTWQRHGKKSLMMRFHMHGGKRIYALFSPGTLQGVFGIVDEIHRTHPDLPIHRD